MYVEFEQYIDSISPIESVIHRDVHIGHCTSAKTEDTDILEKSTSRPGWDCQFMDRKFHFQSCTWDDIYIAAFLSYWSSSLLARVAGMSIGDTGTRGHTETRWHESHPMTSWCHGMSPLIIVWHARMYKYWETLVDTLRQLGTGRFHKMKWTWGIAFARGPES